METRYAGMDTRDVEMETAHPGTDTRDVRSGALHRIAVMTAFNTRRTFSSFGNLLWILIVPVAFSLLLGLLFQDGGTGEAGAGAAQAARVHVLSPRGDGDAVGLLKVRLTFAIYTVFAFAALWARGGALHQEHQHGTLPRMVAGGVAYGEIVAAHVVTIFLVGLVQAAVVVTVTSLMGTPWLAGGWAVLLLTLLGTLWAGAGLALCLSGLTRSHTAMQGLSGGVPPLLGMIGGAFFPLEAAPAGLQQAARVNPVYWAMELMTEGYFFRGVSGQLVPLAVLLLIGILGAVIGIQGLRRVEM